MAEFGLPIAVTIFAWWVSTGLIRLLDGLRRETFRRSMAFATFFLRYLISVTLVTARDADYTQGAAGPAG